MLPHMLHSCTQNECGFNQRNVYTSFPKQKMHLVQTVNGHANITLYNRIYIWYKMLACKGVSVGPIDEQQSVHDTNKIHSRDMFMFLPYLHTAVQHQVKEMCMVHNCSWLQNQSILFAFIQVCCLVTHMLKSLTVLWESKKS